ncbi:hypothetical protein CONLIGDRAFT_675080 [Coniochaeta ligniaria NRRL 30616]|uniref:Uncharacterized protein n=1 Tax=Coniochaeta ligniaria NRRL 30616 TaxID=1408157 RepID=A0A1J7I4R8_9PEZI|nr:hypothetical protein CONLIGDRAFT_675080 [Coniochaeta ligniaria NRRL 30616]
MPHKHNRHKKKAALMAAGQHGSDVSCSAAAMQQDAMMDDDTTSADQQVAVLGADNDSDPEGQMVAATQAYNQATALIAGSSTANAINTLGANNSVKNLAAMAAIGANGNPTPLLLAAAAMSLKEDVDRAFNHAEYSRQSAADALATETGFTDSLRKRWMDEMDKVYADNYNMRAENTVLKADVDRIKSGSGRLMAENWNLNQRIEGLEARVVALEQQVTALLLAGKVKDMGIN